MSCLVNHWSQDLWDQMHPQAILKSYKSTVMETSCTITMPPHKSDLFDCKFIHFVHGCFGKRSVVSCSEMIQPSNASFDSDTLIKWVHEHEHELEFVWWVCASLVISPYLRIFCLGCLFVALRGVLMIREEQIPLKDELHQQKTSIHNMASVCMRLKKLNSALSALSVKASPNWCKLMIECTHEGDAYKRFCYKYWGQFGRVNREIATSVSWRLLLRAPPPLSSLGTKWF